MQKDVGADCHALVRISDPFRGCEVWHGTSSQEISRLPFLGRRQEHAHIQQRRHVMASAFDGRDDWTINAKNFDPEASGSGYFSAGALTVHEGKEGESSSSSCDSKDDEQYDHSADDRAWKRVLAFGMVKDQMKRRSASDSAYRGVARDC